MKILLTSTSFQDTPGKHHELLKAQNWEIDYLRGPVKKDILLPIIGQYDAIICGDDEITEEVILAGKNGKLKAISKYGIGLDKIDMAATKKYGLPVTNTPGVNHITVAEHVLALLFSYYKNIHLEYNITKSNGWTRLIGNELNGKKIAVLGLGRIGKELANRSLALGMVVIGHDIYKDDEFLINKNIQWAETIEELVFNADILSINIPLTENTKNLINLNLLKFATKKLVIINTARASIVNLEDIIFALKNKLIKAYLTDVLEEEPMTANHPLLEFDNVIITPHIGSRTYESVERQGLKAINNLLNVLKLD